MYDIQRKEFSGVTSLSAFGHGQLAIYKPFGKQIKCLSTNQGLPNMNQLTVLVLEECLNCSERIKYISEQTAQQEIQETCLNHIMNLVVADANQMGMTICHKIYYLIFSYLKTLNTPKEHRFDKKIRLLNETQALFYAKQQPKKGLLGELLVGDYQTLINLAKEERRINTNKNIDKQYSLLIQLCLCKVANMSEKDIILWIQKGKESMVQIGDFKKKSKQKKMSDLETCLQLLFGNLEVIETLSKGCWPEYLRLYLLFVEEVDPSAWTDLISSFSLRFSHKSQHQEQEQFLLQLYGGKNFHKSYQRSLNLLPQTLAHIWGYKAFDFGVPTKYVTFNQPNYYLNILGNLLDSANQNEWGCAVRAMGLYQSAVAMDENIYIEQIQNCLYRFFSFDPWENSEALISNISYIRDLIKYGLKIYAIDNLQSLIISHLRLNRITKDGLELLLLQQELAYSPQALKRLRCYLHYSCEDEPFNYQLLEHLNLLLKGKRKLLGSQKIKLIHKVFGLYYFFDDLKHQNNVATKMNKIIGKYGKLSTESVQSLRILKEVILQRKRASINEQQLDKNFKATIRVYLDQWIINNSHIRMLIALIKNYVYD